MVIVHMYEGHVIVRVCACINNCFSEYTCRCWSANSHPPSLSDSTCNGIEILVSCQPMHNILRA